VFECPISSHAHASISYTACAVYAHACTLACMRTSTCEHPPKTVTAFREHPPKTGAAFRAGGPALRKGAAHRHDEADRELGGGHHLGSGRTAALEIEGGSARKGH
jgi:hypothetical protein